MIYLLPSLGREQQSGECCEPYICFPERGLVFPFASPNGYELFSYQRCKHKMWLSHLGIYKCGLLDHHSSFATLLHTYACMYIYGWVSITVKNYINGLVITFMVCLNCILFLLGFSGLVRTVYNQVTLIGQSSLASSQQPEMPPAFLPPTPTYLLAPSPYFVLFPIPPAPPLPSAPFPLPPPLTFWPLLLTFWSVLAWTRLSVLAFSFVRMVVISLATFWIWRLNSRLVALPCSISCTFSWI